MTKPRRSQIVVAWVATEYRAVPGARVDLGERPRLVEVKVGRACMWLREGSSADRAKARAYAKTVDGGARVYSYPLTEAEPLERARREVLSVS